MPYFVIWSASYALAKTLECEGSISSSTVWATIIHTFFSLIHPVHEFSFKEMSIMWGQPKISSCCLCVWCKSEELGGIRSKRFPISMVESFSADFVSAIESYWTVAFRILPNNDGAPVRKYMERRYMIGLMMVVLMVFCIPSSFP